MRLRLTPKDYEQKQINWRIKRHFKDPYQLTSGSVGIPASKLLGQSVGGLNAVGDNEIRDYYDLLISMQNNSFRPALRVIDELMLNEIGAPELDYQWRPLWSPSAKETAEINKLNADLIVQLQHSNVYRRANNGRSSTANGRFNPSHRGFRR